MAQAQSKKTSGEFVVYTTDDGDSRVECRFSEDTL